MSKWGNYISSLFGRIVNYMRGLGISEFNIGPIGIKFRSDEENKPALEAEKIEDHNKSEIQETNTDVTRQKEIRKLRAVVDPFFGKIENDADKDRFDDPNEWLDSRICELFDNDLQDIFDSMEDCIFLLEDYIQNDEDSVVLFADKKEETASLLKELVDSKDNINALLTEGDTGKDYFINYCKWVYIMMKAILRFVGL